jgi:hypothetical protein
MTIKQTRYFFELVDKLNYDKEIAKNRAKKKYNKTKFEDLTTEEIDPLITILENELKAAKVKEPTEDFPNNFRVWDKQEEKMIYEYEFIQILDLSLSEKKDRFHVMLFTGKKDDNDQKIFDFDFVESFTKRTYLVQWSWKDCAWNVIDTETNDSMYLASLGKCKRIGDVYEGVQE